MWHYIIQINSHWHYQICRHQWSFRDLNHYWLPTVLEILQRFQRKQGYGRTMKDSRSHLISDWRFEIPLTNIYQYLWMSIYIYIYIRRCSWRQCLFYLRIYGFYKHDWAQLILCKPRMSVHPAQEQLSELVTGPVPPMISVWFWQSMHRPMILPMLHWLTVL